MKNKRIDIFLPSLSAKSGFTLIELMVVIAIIAVLAAVVAPQVFRQVEKGRVASALTFYDSVKAAATSYFADMGSWPAGWCSYYPSDLTYHCDARDPGFVNATTSIYPRWDGPYLGRWPVANPWNTTYWWGQGVGTQFGPSADERYLEFLVPTQAA